MFGGYGIYKNGLIFGLIIDNELYFKGDDIAVEFYKTYNSRPFTYSNKNDKIVTMNYWTVPPEAMEDKDKIVEWVNVALEAAVRAKKI